MAIETRLVRLACQGTEDSTGADQACLTYDGERVFGPSSIEDGETLNLGIVRPLSGEARVALFDEDPLDTDAVLGSVTISRSELGLGLRHQDLTRNGARYTLFYRVVRVGDG